MTQKPIVIPEPVEAAQRILEAGDTVSARRMLSGLPAARHHEPHVVFLLGVCDYREGRLRDAESRMREVLSLAPDRYKAAHFLGLSLSKQGRSKEAVSAWQAAVTIRPDFAPAREKLAEHGAVPLPQAAAQRPPLPGLPGPTTARPAEEPEIEGPGEVLAEGHMRAAPVIMSRALLAAVLFGIGALGAAAGPGRTMDEEGIFLVGAIILVLGIFIILPVAYTIGKSTARVAAAMGGASLVLLVALVAFLTPIGPPIALLFGIVALAEGTLRSRMTRYRIHANRIDCEEGILLRKHRSAWLYEIVNTDYVRGPLLLLGNTGAIRIKAQSEEFRIQGIGDSRYMKALWDELRNAVLKERRTMKKWWI